jgi:hypothetical protein
MSCGKHKRVRRGVMTVIAIVCTVVAAAMMVIAVRRALAESRLSQLDVRQAQCRWLLESGLERAAARLAADPKYAGEIWRIPGQSITDRPDPKAQQETAVVRIDVTTPADQPLRRQVTVRADWPEDPQLRARHDKRATVQLAAEAKGK